MLTSEVHVVLNANMEERSLLCCCVRNDRLLKFVDTEVKFLLLYIALLPSLDLLKTEGCVEELHVLMCCHFQAEKRDP